MKRIILIVFLLLSTLMFSQSQTVTIPVTNWSTLIKLAKFDPIDDQQSVADTDFVGNENHSIMETQKVITTFTDGITEQVYYFRVRMGQSNPSTSFYLGIDITGDLIADLFIEANVKSKPNYVSFHQRDYSKSGLSPSQTAWLNGSQNQELILTSRNAEIRTYSAFTDLDGGNSGTDYWIEFGLTEQSLKSYVLNTLGKEINGDSVIALYGFTSTSQTSNGDVMGVDDKIAGELDKTWVELGVIINGSLNNITSGVIVTPTVNQIITEDTTPTLTGTWGGNMLGDDSLSVNVNDVNYTTTNGLIIDKLNWSITIPTNLNYGIYEVTATTSRSSSLQSVSDTTSLELQINYPEQVVDQTAVTSGNDGGLESNGGLATLIAKRNFIRFKTNSFANQKKTQKKYKSSSNYSKTLSKTSSSGFDFSAVIPNTGLLGTETAFVSSPTDLIGITNAQQIYSVDYYQADKRVAVILATTTTGGIYGHSKAICDRLNKSSLEDITTINLNGYEIIMVKLVRANGEIEYALNFSIQRLTNENKLHSYWNIDQYPVGDYINFQIWSSSIGEIWNLASSIISKFKEQTTLSAIAVDNRIPSVFVKKGFYKNGELHLKIINKSKSSNIAFQGNKKSTELASLTSISENINLSSDYEQSITIKTDGLFDIGFSILGNNSQQKDNLYLADGPWGVDYLKTESTFSLFEIKKNTNTNSSNDSYTIERNATVSGTVYGTLNLFRNILAGDQSLNASTYSQVEFAIKNSLPIEIVLVTENATDWNDRLRYQISSNNDVTPIAIQLSDFSNLNGTKYNNEKIRGFVFSVKGNYSQFQPFSLSVNDLTLSAKRTLVTPNLETIATINKAYNYPNPFSQRTTIVLPENASQATVKLLDVSGRVLLNRVYDLSTSNTINFENDNAPKGLYILSIVTDDKKEYQIKSVIK